MREERRPGMGAGAEQGSHVFSHVHAHRWAFGILKTTCLMSGPGMMMETAS